MKCIKGTKAQNIGIFHQGLSVRCSVLFTVFLDVRFLDVRSVRVFGLLGVRRVSKTLLSSIGLSMMVVLTLQTAKGYSESVRNFSLKTMGQSLYSCIFVKNSQ